MYWLFDPHIEESKFIRRCWETIKSSVKKTLFCWCEMKIFNINIYCRNVTIVVSFSMKCYEYKFDSFWWTIELRRSRWVQELQHVCHYYLMTLNILCIIYWNKKITISYRGLWIFGIETDYNINALTAMLTIIVDR